jgi:hypothetical protein
MSYNPYLAVNDESSFDASGTTLVGDKKLHYSQHADPHSIGNAEYAPLVRQDFGIFIVRLPFNNLSLLKDTQTPTRKLPPRRIYHVLLNNRPS